MDFLNSTSFTLLSFVLFTVLVAVISYFKSKGVNENAGSGYYLAGRSLSGIVIAGSLIMTDLSAVQLIGNNGQSVNVGMGVFAAQGLGFSGMILAAVFLIPKYLKAGISTMPEFYEIRFDKFTRNLVTCLMIINYSFIMIPSALYAGAQVFINIFGVDQALHLSYFETMVVLCIVIALIGSIYAIFGGLKAIAVSDTINGVGMLIGGILVTIFALLFLSSTLGGNGTLLDGLDKFLHTDPAMMNAWNEATSNEPWWPWPVIFTGLTINNLYYWGCDQAIVQRAFGAKSMAHAQKGMIYAGLLTLITPFFLVFPGIIAKFVFPGTDFSSNGDIAFPMLIAQTLPKPILGFFAACMFGAILSTFNSMLNSACTIFAMNIYKDGFNKNASDRQIIKAGKIFGTVVAICATAISPFLAYVDGIFTWMNAAIGLFSMPILVLTLFAIFSKRAPRYVGKVMIPIHIVLYILLYYILPNFIPALGKVHYMYWYVVLFAVDFLIAWTMTKLHPLQQAFIMPENAPQGMDLSPWKYRKHAIAATLAITAIIYILFSPLCFGKSEQTTWERHQQSQATAMEVSEQSLS